jgi:predicted NodU family carbamoyl transferase
MSSNRVKREDYFYSTPDQLFDFVDRSPGDYVKMECGGDMPPIYFIQHHRAHAANAFFLSDFSKAAFLTADWQGELECLTKGIGDGNKLEILDTQWVPHSLGIFYATFTQLLGYRHDNDEWKVMALSAAQVDSQQYVRFEFLGYTLCPTKRVVGMPSNRRLPCSHGGKS